ncbi:sensor histidine kinase [Actinoallomurus iriomotensis]|uniref:histidine kinase n=1 Tax=Actinoallomurus iriomotensis TaxID=478107 RepID=A0A9W6RPW8_9ACTN|nr:sensor histidine kinase [Actinoallomurus iriomotensis]GLY77957.1 two-component sensor histidine kinase [Actinoallomurus iriomotensis]
MTGERSAAAPRRGRIRSRLRVGRVDIVVALDFVIALLFFALDNAVPRPPHPSPGHPSDVLLILVSFITAAPLTLRDRRPLAAWLCSAGGVLAARALLLAQGLSLPYLPGAVVVYLLCLYAVGVRGGNRVTAGAAVVTVVGAAVVDSSTAAVAVPMLVPLVAGHLVRMRRTTRQVLAEQEARHAAETAVLEERQRIARELHDVVAHHMSVIAIQAEAAPYKVTDPPPELAESFADIRASALEGLTELRRVLGVLRTGHTPETTPQPGLDRLEEVVASARSGGLTVEVSSTGEPPPLPQGVALSAHRILQEALSNAMKHAPGASVTVDIDYRSDELRLRVVNGPGTAPRPVAESGGGHGLVGMRERASMLGGTLAVGPRPDGGFAVTAVLPYQKATA